ncbi:MAG: hypothetical protein EOP48_09625 [Sphingobacteriales bacterium]|nr:MAG: hypothetical protein EOP48_09625 [Sphingobacteriales bacterium]
MNQLIWEIYVPLLLSLITCSYFLNRKLSSLDTDFKRKSKFLIILFGIMTTVGMLFMLNRYTKESNEPLIELPDVTKLDTTKAGKYYKLDKYSVNPYGGHYFNYTRNRKRRGGSQLKLNLYITLPLIKDKKEEITQFPTYWYGLKFTMNVSRSENEESKFAQEEKFLQESHRKVSAMTFEDEKYFELITGPTEKKLYFNSINNIRFHEKHGKYVVLTPNFQSYNHKAMVALYWFLAIFVFGVLAFMAVILEASLTKKSGDPSNI